MLTVTNNNIKLYFTGWNNGSYVSPNGSKKNPVIFNYKAALDGDMQLVPTLENGVLTLLGKVKYLSDTSIQVKVVISGFNTNSTLASGSSLFSCKVREDKQLTITITQGNKLFFADSTFGGRYGGDYANGSLATGANTASGNWTGSGYTTTTDSTTYKLTPVAANALSFSENLTERKNSGSCVFFVSDTVNSFSKNAGLFLQQNVSQKVKMVDIEKYSVPAERLI